MVGTRATVSPAPRQAPTRARSAFPVRIVASDLMWWPMARVAYGRAALNRPGALASGAPAPQSRGMMSTGESGGKVSPARVIVIGNEKGGAGKSTVAVHIATSLLHEGARVVVVDLDVRQQSTGHFFASRAAWNASQNAGL